MARCGCVDADPGQLGAAVVDARVSHLLAEDGHAAVTGRRDVHLASIAVVAVAVVMLIAPATYHRIAAQGNAEEGVLQDAVWMMLPAEWLIADGLVGDA